jgi:hypothetical protein
MLFVDFQKQKSRITMESSKARCLIFILRWERERIMKFMKRFIIKETAHYSEIMWLPS